MINVFLKSIKHNIFVSELLTSSCVELIIKKLFRSAGKKVNTRVSSLNKFINPIINGFKEKF